MSGKLIPEPDHGMILQNGNEVHVGAKRFTDMSVFLENLTFFRPLSDSVLLRSWPSSPSSFSPPKQNENNIDSLGLLIVLNFINTQNKNRPRSHSVALGH